jgi:hypothetical protein
LGDYEAPFDPPWVLRLSNPTDNVLLGRLYARWPEGIRGEPLERFERQGNVKYCFRDILWEMCKDKMINPAAIWTAHTEIYHDNDQTSKPTKQEENRTQVQNAINGITTIE